MPFEEKSAWVSGISVALCGLWYASTAWSNLAVEGFMDGGYHRPLIASVILAIIIMVVSYIALSIATPKEADQRDERDREIERFGEYIGQFVLSGMGLIVIGMAIAELDHFWIASLAYFGLILAEVVTSVARIAAYRFGINEW